MQTLAYANNNCSVCCCCCCSWEINCQWLHACCRANATAKWHRLSHSRAIRTSSHSESALMFNSSASRVHVSSCLEAVTEHSSANYLTCAVLKCGAQIVHYASVAEYTTLLYMPDVIAQPTGQSGPMAPNFLEAKTTQWVKKTRHQTLAHNFAKY